MNLLHGVASSILLSVCPGEILCYLRGRKASISDHGCPRRAQGINLQEAGKCLGSQCVQPFGGGDSRGRRGNSLSEHSFVPLFLCSFSGYLLGIHPKKTLSKESLDFCLVVFEVINLPFFVESWGKVAQLGSGKRIGGLGALVEVSVPSSFSQFRAQSSRQVATMFLVSGSWVHLPHNTFLLFFCSKPKREWSYWYSWLMAFVKKGMPMQQR